MNVKKSKRPPTDAIKRKSTNKSARNSAGVTSYSAGVPARSTSEKVGASGKVESSPARRDDEFLGRDLDLSKAKRAKDVPHLNKLREGKTRITIMLDDDILAEFRKRANAGPPGYQTLINQALREQLGKVGSPVDEATLRRVVREELAVYEED